ncbi:MAG: hypothetical protein ACTHOR_01790 [Devosia sp.]
MTTTITPEQQAAIATYLEGRHIPPGIGTEDEACSIAAINLALSGQLTDEIPECMSEVIGRWIIVVQDAMPDEMRNSPAWRRLLPLAAGTGREREADRLAIILDWMWGTVLPTLQPLADKHGLGTEWRRMIAERNHEAAAAAAPAAWALPLPVSARAAWAAWAAAATEAPDTEMAAADAGETAAWAAAADAGAWHLFDPLALLEKLITLDGGTNG